MQKLAKREEQIMQVLWDLEKAFVKEIVAALPDPKPHQNSVATMVRILQDKGFVAHNTFGRTHQFYPIISREKYQETAVEDVLGKYFAGSYSKMVTYFAENENISKNELEDILKIIKGKDSK